MHAAARFGTRRRRRQFVIRRLKLAAGIAASVSVAIGVVGAAVHPGISEANGPVVDGYEVATIADTAYPIPAGAIFVDTNGANSNPGTQSAPFATISKALDAAPSGATIVVRGGTYREAFGSITKRVTLQPYPHEKVWVKGSVVVNGFTASGGDWVKGGWNPPLCRNCYDSAAIDPDYPAAGLTDQAFIDGTPLRQVKSRAALAGGTFFVDNVANQLWLGSDPSGHTVESTVLERALQFNTSYSSGSIVRGIGFAHYAPHYDMTVPAAVVANTPDITFDHDTFAWSANRGLSVLDPGAVVTDNLFLNNGLNGAHAHRADGLIFEGNRIANSNIEHYSITPSGAAQIAAIKITNTHNAVIRKNIVEDNLSNGIWLDVASYNGVITNNTVARNAGHGIAFEVSARAIIAGNLIVGSGRDGIKLSGATSVATWNNTIVDSGWAQLGVYEDPRVNHDPAEVALGITFDAANINLYNNILVGTPNSTKSMLTSFDTSQPKHVTTQGMIAADDHNLWVRPTAANPRYLAQWQATLVTTKNFASLADVRAGTGRERSSIAADDVALSSVFTNPSAGDYTLAPSSPGRATGASLPVAVAAAMGVSPGPIHLGALGLSAFVPTTTTVATTPTTVGAPTTTVDPTTTTLPTTTTTPAPTTTTIVSESPLTASVYGLWNHATGDRIYTTSSVEVAADTAAGYASLGVVFRVANARGPGLVAIYRLHHGAGEHIYTPWTRERDGLVRAGWKLEGTAFYAPPRRVAGAMQVRRYYDRVHHDHYLGTNATAASGSRLDAKPFWAAP